MNKRLFYSTYDIMYTESGSQWHWQAMPILNWLLFTEFREARRGKHLLLAGILRHDLQNFISQLVYVIQCRTS